MFFLLYFILSMRIFSMQILICLSSCIKYNAPKHFEVLRSKTSICVPVLWAVFFYVGTAVSRRAEGTAMIFYDTKNFL